MSDLLEAASAALGTPSELVQRSAAARAVANGTTVDEVLGAWGGGAPVAAAPVAAEPAVEEAPAEVETAPEPEPITAPVMVIEDPEPQPAAEAEPEAPLEPAPFGRRLKTAVRIGAWTGAALGVVGFLTATAFWAPNALVLADGGPIVEVRPTYVMIGVALVSVVFGAVVAGISRSATAWTDPAMELSGSKSGTAWLGGLLGLILGLIAGAILSSFGTVVEGSDPEVTQLPVLATLAVMVIGGAILGAATAVVPQVLGVPVAVNPADSEELEVVRGRLGNAFGIPMVGLMLLLLLVLPFAWALIESNELLPGAGGAVVAIIAAGGILGFAALAGSKPQMRISFGDAMVAVVGIGIVLIILLAVLFANSDEENVEDGAEEAAVTQLI